MREKILPVLIGILIGAIIATSGFLIYEKYKEKENSNSSNVEQIENEDSSANIRWK